MIEGLAGVIVWTDDLERLFRFYRDVLGLAPHSIRPNFISFKWGDVRLGLGKHSEVEGSTKDPYRIMVNLGVDDIHAQCDRLRQKGVVFEREPEKEHWGGWVATFSDPDGNALQLLQQPEQARP